MKTALLVLIAGILFGTMACHKGQDISAIEPSPADTVRHITPVTKDTTPKVSVRHLISKRSYSGIFSYEDDTIDGTYGSGGPDTMFVFQYEQDSIVTKSANYDFLMTWYHGDTLVHSSRSNYDPPCPMFLHSFSEMKNNNLHIDTYNIGVCASLTHSKFDGLPL